MRFKDFLPIVDTPILFVYTIENNKYVTLAFVDTNEPFTKYSEESDKAKEVAETDEYVVENVRLLDGNKPSIAVKLKKEVA